jgi:hypothetical protein
MQLPVSTAAAAVGTEQINAGLDPKKPQPPAATILRVLESVLCFGQGQFMILTNPL